MRQAPGAGGARGVWQRQVGRGDGGRVFFYAGVREVCRLWRRARGSSSPVSQLNAAPVRAPAHGARLTHRPAPCLCTMPATPSRRARAGRPGPAKAAPASSSSLTRCARRLLDPADTRAAVAVAVLVLLGEALMTGLIIWRVPCEFEGRERALGRSRGLGMQDVGARALDPQNLLALVFSHVSHPPLADTEIDWSTYMEQLAVIDKACCVSERERCAEGEREALPSPHQFSPSSFSPPSISVLSFSHNNRASATTPASAGRRDPWSTRPATSGCTGPCAGRRAAGPFRERRCCRPGCTCPPRPSPWASPSPPGPSRRWPCPCWPPPSGCTPFTSSACSTTAGRRRW